eukprot:CAMPEP_0172448898 /NCGR_PEP_ID=MMETSP1065-20121228/7793_1 /TAXON_ID=265537 /ORGANISM="Amphiprora paludosa, Strain CCMP125" /LENGTH=161 /DNA_ID=CAMNT_0013200491 /DNA_START=150 /DNA_END=635 /DNA_ORIENTATION=+
MLLLNPTEFFSNPQPSKMVQEAERRTKDFHSKPPLSPTRPADAYVEEVEILYPASPTSAMDINLMWHRDIFAGLQYPDFSGKVAPSTRVSAQAGAMPQRNDDDDSSIESAISENEEELVEEEEGEEDELLGLSFLREEMCKMVHVDMGHFRLEPPQACSSS